MKNTFCWLHVAESLPLVCNFESAYKTMRNPKIYPNISLDLSYFFFVLVLDSLQVKIFTYLNAWWRNQVIQNT